MDGPECPFCAISRGEAPAHVVFEGPEVVAFLDARPLFPGHTLVIPRDHFETLADVPYGLLAPLGVVVQACSAAMESALGSQGSFVAVNNRVSQSVPHVHFHVVPRSRGDGLRGFFWPRRKYRDADEQADYSDRLRAGVQAELDRRTPG